MAPTELLAEQHHTSFQRLCGNLGIPAALLTGKVQGSARARLLHGLNSGAVPIVFGTHAIIQERVRLSRLGLGIIDEQHRFGVFDRAKLKALGPAANLLMMTATPIPRSLALSLFANLNISFLDELPPGRTPVETLIFDETNLDGVDEIVRGELAEGNRAYYVLPRIDASDEERRSVAAAADASAAGCVAGSGVGSGAGADAPGSPPIRASTVPTTTVSPSWTRISETTPDAGDGTSVSTLSVEISSSVSSASIVSPTFFDHFVTVPSETETPICGITTSTAVVLAISS